MENNTSSKKKTHSPLMLWHPVHLLSLGFGSGLSPIAPGTAGSLLGWFSFIALNLFLNTSAWWVLIILGFIVGIFATGWTAKKMQIADPSAVVWDEIIAMWLVLVCLPCATFIDQFWAFVVFRFFDAIKPFPIRTIDQKVKGGFGIMIDDILAAIFTLGVLYLWKHFII